MKILQVNKYHYYRAGAEKYYLDISNELKKQGHELAYFAMQDENNINSKWSKYFVSKLDFHNLSYKDKLKLPGRIIYSLEAKRKFKKIVEDFKPDVIHAHNIYHHISPSILSVAKKKNIPVILHLQDYKIISPNYNIYSHGKNHWDYCGGRFYRCLFNKCFKNSYIQSFLVSLEYFVHHYLINIYNKNVDVFIAPSLFMKEKASMFSVEAEKIAVINNHIQDNEISNEAQPKGDYWLYFGRLAVEKGIQDLISALNKIDDNSKLKIAGDGPYKKELEDLILKLKLNDRVEFLGKKQKQELKEIIKKAKAVIIPSIWPENFPFALLETIAMGKPAIIANSGGMPEIINHEENGFIFEAGNVDDLKEKMLNIDKIDYMNMANKALESSKKYKLSKTIIDLTLLYNKLVIKK
ncbi:MAG TPA: glycosyltransferase [Patescibacteria group bacterium]|nr:glycosyltransferase [Patescibacteria group bacterium]